MALRPLTLQAANIIEDSRFESKALTPIERFNNRVVASTHLPLQAPEGFENHPIRLVTIKKAADIEPISCEIFETTLDESIGEYDALSYCWGSQDIPYGIFLNGLKFSVTQNLFEALSELRRSSEQDRVMWIDALCINQLDMKERTFQVRQMHRVFQNANETIMWLGQGTEHSESFCKVAADWGWERVDIESSMTDLANQSDGLVLDFLRGLVELYECNYWTRVWVAQEIFCSRNHDITVFWGENRLDYRLFPEIYDAYSAQSEHSALKTALLRQCMRGEYVQIEQILQLKGPASMPHLLLSVDDDKEDFDSYVRPMRNKFCSDPKDHVFGFYHALPHFWKNRITINYDFPLVDIYQQTTLAHIIATDRLEILALPKCSQQSDIHASWVTDWSLPVRALWYTHWCMGTAYVRSRGYFKFSEHHKALTVRGVVIGTVRGRDGLIQRSSPSTNSVLFDKLSLYRHGLKTYYDSLNVGLRTMSDPRQIQYWILIAFGMGQDVDSNLLDTIFGSDKNEELSSLAIEWLTMAYELNIDRVLVEVQGVFDVWNLERLVMPQLPDYELSDDSIRIKVPGLTYILPRPLYPHMRELAFGMTNPRTRTGDLVCVLDGCTVPLILRQGPAGCFTLIGDACLSTMYDFVGEEDKMRWACEQGNLAMREFTFI